MIMRDIFILLILLAGALASITIQPTAPVKIGDSVSWDETVDVTVLRYSVFNNSTNQTTCYASDNGLSQILCQEINAKTATAKLDVGDTKLSEQLDCTKQDESTTFLEGVNITSSNPTCNTTQLNQTYRCSHIFMYTPSTQSPGEDIPYTASISSIPKNESVDGNISIQGTNLTIDSIPDDKDGSITVSGVFVWNDSTPLVGKPIEINSPLCTFPKTDTDAKGAYSATCSYDEYTPSKSYPINVTGYYSLQHTEEATSSVNIFGKTDVKFNTSRSITHSNSMGTAAFQYVWEIIKGTDITHVLITADLTGTNQTFAKECPGTPGETFSECSGSFLATAPKRWGNYTFDIEARWDDARGVTHDEHRSELLVVDKESTFSLDKPTLLQDIPVGGSADTTMKVSTSGNVNTTLNVSTNGFISILGTDGKPTTHISLPSDGEVPITIRMSLPYGMHDIVKDSIPFINDFGLTRELAYTLTPRQPKLQWKDAIVKAEADTENITIQNTLENMGSRAQNVSVSVTCPKLWVCKISDSMLPNLNEGKNKQISFAFDMAYLGDETNKTLTVTAEDAAGRTSTFDIDLGINAKNSVAISDEVITTSINNPNFNDRALYFIDNNTLVRRTTMQTSGISPRVKRDSELSSWVVSSMPDSKGIGEVCDAYVLVNNRSYLIDSDPSVITTLIGKKGDVAYEYIIPKADGECRVHLDYGGVQTLSYVDITSQQQQSTYPMTSAEIQNIINESSKKSTQPLSDMLTYLSFALAALAGVYGYYVFVYKRKGIEVPKRKTKPVFVIGNIRGLAERSKDTKNKLDQRLDKIFQTKKQKDDELTSKPFGKFFLKLNEKAEGDGFKWD